MGGRIGESCVLGFLDVANNHESTAKTARNDSREQFMNYNSLLWRG